MSSTASTRSLPRSRPGGKRTANARPRWPRPTRGARLHPCGPNGAGHFVKMVHNGIEYGLMQAYAEGFEILKEAHSQSLPEAERLDLDLADIAEVWRRGSVISSWLLDLTASALADDSKLDAYSGFVEDSGEGRWTIPGCNRGGGTGRGPFGCAVRAFSLASRAHVCPRKSCPQCAKDSRPHRAKGYRAKGCRAKGCRAKGCRAKGCRAKG